MSISFLRLILGFAYSDSLDRYMMVVFGLWMETKSTLFELIYFYKYFVKKKILIQIFAKALA